MFSGWIDCDCYAIRLVNAECVISTIEKFISRRMRPAHHRLTVSR